MKVSILTVTKRVGWEKYAEESLLNQTYKDFEYIVVTENPLHFTKLKPTIIDAPAKRKVSNLNASNNEGLRHCKGEYIIFYQDFILLEPDCIEKLVNLATPNTFVTTLTKNPDGEEEDPRYTWLDAPRPCLPQEWEENVGLAPMAILKELGGYDEEYDDGWAWNNVNVAERAEMLGCNFVLDESNRPQLIFHIKEPVLNKNMPLNGELHALVMQKIKDGELPLKNTYL
jgi:glycosyltransferase involved in cell wall biosynthesis